MEILVDLTRWGSLGQAAEAAGCSPQRVAQLAACGRIETISIPLGRLYSLEACAALAARRAERSRGREDAGGAAP